jgi:hypothetical protein
MGIMSNKVTRRVALGSILGGLAGTTAVLAVLRSKYQVDLATSAHSVDGATVLGGHATRRIYGYTIPIDMPVMAVKNAADREKYAHLAARALREQTYKALVKLPESERRALVARYVEDYIKRWQARIDKIDSCSLWESLSDGLDEPDRKQLSAKLAKMTDAEKARRKQALKSQLAEGLAKWKGGEGQKKFEQHQYNVLFTPPKPLTEAQQLQIDKEVTRGRLKCLSDGSFEKSMRRSIEKSFQNMVKTGRIFSYPEKQVVDKAVENAVRREQDWASGK